jgi:hypothetical protein
MANPLRRPGKKTSEIDLVQRVLNDPSITREDLVSLFPQEKQKEKIKHYKNALSRYLNTIKTLQKSDKAEDKQTVERLKKWLIDAGYTEVALLDSKSTWDNEELNLALKEESSRLVKSGTVDSDYGGPLKQDPNQSQRVIQSKLNFKHQVSSIYKNAYLAEVLEAMNITDPTSEAAVEMTMQIEEAFNKIPDLGEIIDTETGAVDLQNQKALLEAQRRITSRLDRLLETHMEFQAEQMNKQLPGVSVEQGKERLRSGTKKRLESTPLTELNPVFEQAQAKSSDKTSFKVKSAAKQVFGGLSALQAAQVIATDTQEKDTKTVAFPESTPKPQIDQTSSEKSPISFEAAQTEDTVNQNQRQAATLRKELINELVPQATTKQKRQIAELPADKFSQGLERINPKITENDGFTEVVAINNQLRQLEKAQASEESNALPKLDDNQATKTYLDKQRGQLRTLGYQVAETSPEPTKKETPSTQTQIKQAQNTLLAVAVGAEKVQSVLESQTPLDEALQDQGIPVEQAERVNQLYNQIGEISSANPSQAKEQVARITESINNDLVAVRSDQDSKIITFPGTPTENSEETEPTTLVNDRAQEVLYSLSAITESVEEADERSSQEQLQTIETRIKEIVTDLPDDTSNEVLIKKVTEVLEDEGLPQEFNNLKTSAVAETFVEAMTVADGSQPLNKTLEVSGKILSQQPKTDTYGQLTDSVTTLFQNSTLKNTAAIPLIAAELTAVEFGRSKGVDLSPGKLQDNLGAALQSGDREALSEAMSNLSIDHSESDIDTLLFNFEVNRDLLEENKALNQTQAEILSTYIVSSQKGSPGLADVATISAMVGNKDMAQVSEDVIKGDYAKYFEFNEADLQLVGQEARDYQKSQEALLLPFLGTDAYFNPEMGVEVNTNDYIKTVQKSWLSLAHSENSPIDWDADFVNTIKDEDKLTYLLIASHLYDATYQPDGSISYQPSTFLGDSSLPFRPELEKFISINQDATHNFLIIPKEINFQALQSLQKQMVDQGLGVTRQELYSRFVNMQRAYETGAPVTSLMILRELYRPASMSSAGSGVLTTGPSLSTGSTAAPTSNATFSNQQPSQGVLDILNNFGSNNVVSQGLGKLLGQGKLANNVKNLFGLGKTAAKTGGLLSKLRGLSLLGNGLKLGALFTSVWFWVILAAVFLIFIVLSLYLTDHTMKSAFVPSSNNNKLSGPLVAVKQVGYSENCSQDAPSGRLSNRLQLSNEEFEQLNPKCFYYSIEIFKEAGAPDFTISEITDTLTVGPESLEFDISDQLSSLVGTYTDDTVNSITYLIDFDLIGNFPEEIIDQAITNSLVISYDVEGALEVETQEANILVGDADPSIGEGCWPSTGEIKQLPYDDTFSHISSDAYDIGAPIGELIFAPVSGTATAYPQGSFGGDWDGAGNFVVIESSLGDFLFQHLSDFSNIVQTNTPIAIEAGQLIGYIGLTGNTTGPHLHYEHRPSFPNLSSCQLAGSCLGVPSELERLVPGDVNGAPVTRIGQNVDTDVCNFNGSDSDDPGSLASSVDECFRFTSGTKSWTESEIDQVSAVLEEKIIDSELHNRLVCGGGRVVNFERVGGSCQDAGGAWAGFTLNSTTVRFYDCLFEFGGFNNGTYGRFSVIHELGHVVRSRFISVFDDLADDYAFFTASGNNSFWGTSYPYDYAASGQTPTATVRLRENTGEAFSACHTQNYGAYRGGQGVPNNFTEQCAAMNDILNQLANQLE